MNKARRLFALVAILATMAACSQAATASESATPSPSPVLATPAPTAAPSPTAVPSPDVTTAPSPSPDDQALVFAPDGIGPYLIGTSMSDLESQELIANVGDSFHCDDSWKHADATGSYRLDVTFHLGRVIHVGTNSADLVTPDGASIGMSPGELQGIYGSRGVIVLGTMGNQAFVVRESDTALGLVFYLDETNTKADAMSAGEIETLEEFLIRGEGC